MVRTLHVKDEEVDVLNAQLGHDGRQGLALYCGHIGEPILGHLWVKLLEGVRSDVGRDHEVVATTLECRWQWACM